MTPNTATPVELVSAGFADLGEGPVWDERSNRIYWVDIIAGRLHWLNHGDPERKTVQLDRTVSFVAPTKDPNTVIVGAGAELVWLDLPTERCERMCDLEPVTAKLRCNDGKCDPTGRLWAGTMQWGGDADFGSLYAIGEDLQCSRRLDRVRISNGLAWHPEQAMMYFIDSPTRRIDKFEWDRETGRIGNRNILASFAKADGTPDGMTIDREGQLWVAFWGGGCVRRIDGETGVVLAEIALPTSQVTSCTFGGAGYDTLFVTTAADGLSPPERAQEPLAGALFALRPGVIGTAPHLFAGPSTAKKPAREAASNRSVPGVALFPR